MQNLSVDSASLQACLQDTSFTFYSVIDTDISPDYQVKYGSILIIMQFEKREQPSYSKNR